MAEYPLTLAAAKRANLDQLQAQAVAAGLPVTGINGDPSANSITAFTSRDLTQQEQTMLAGMVAAYDGRPRRLRKFLDIYNDINALSAANKTAVWNQLNLGTPPLWATDAGPQAPALGCYQLVGQYAAAGTLQTEGRLRMAATYVLDNPRWMINPSWAPTVSIPGDEPYTP